MNDVQSYKEQFKQLFNKLYFDDNTKPAYEEHIKRYNSKVKIEILDNIFEIDFDYRVADIIFEALKQINDYAL